MAKFLGVEDRAQALRPQAVRSARPAVPAVEAQIGEGDGVAVEPLVTWLRSRPSANDLAGSWQVAHERVSSSRQAGSKNSCRPSAMAAGTPDTRLLGSGGTFGGQGPCDRIAARFLGGEGRCVRCRHASACEGDDEADDGPRAVMA
jgi:hypothetical protein